MKSKIALIIAMTLAAGTAVAGSWEDGFYVGAGVGYGKLNVDNDKLDNAIDAGLAPTGFQVTNSNVGQGATPYELTVGYKWMKYLATEVSYLDAGNATYHANISDGVDGGTVKAQWDVKGWPVSMLGIWPIDDSWSVFGRVGVFIGDVKLTAKAVDDAGFLLAKGHNSDSTTEFLGGVGVDYAFMDTWFTRLEWQAMPSLGSNETGSGNWNNIQWSIFYKF